MTVDLSRHWVDRLGYWASQARGPEKKRDRGVGHLVACHHPAHARIVRI